MAGSAAARRAAVAGLRVRWHRWKRADSCAKGRALRRTQRNEIGASDDATRYLCAIVRATGAGRPHLRAARGLGEAAMAKTGVAGRAGLPRDAELRPRPGVPSRRPRGCPPQAFPVSRSRSHLRHVGMVRQDLPCLEQTTRRAQQTRQDTKPFPGLQAERQRRLTILDFIYSFIYSMRHLKDTEVLNLADVL